MDVMAPKAVLDIQHRVFNNDPALHWWPLPRKASASNLNYWRPNP
jgi:hypothetical protein